jgi:hypothetical protein
MARISKPNDQEGELLAGREERKLILLKEPDSGDQ